MNNSNKGRGLIYGITSYFKAATVISRNKLWPYLIVPGLLSVCYIGLLITLGVIYLTGLSTDIITNYFPVFLQGGFMHITISIILWILLLILIFITYKEVVLILFSPILGYLSEKIEKALYNREPPPFSLKRLIIDIVRGLILFIRNLILMLILTLLAWLVIFIPFLGTIASPILILIVQAYYTGIGLTDITLERKKYSIKKSLHFARDNRASMIGLGVGFIILLMIPLIGWFAAPGLGISAATIVSLEKINA
jgi:CysZ protein